jgi:cytochrome c-type biogenesis protein CcmH
MSVSKQFSLRVGSRMRSLLAAALAVGVVSICSAGAAHAQSAAPAPAPAAATNSAPGASDASERYAERLRALSLQLRCLVCQNQTLADSQAELASDLRREVEEQIEQGKTDDEIKAYLVARYGDFVLYKPPVQRNTMMLWFGPFALLLVGVAAWLLVQRRSRARRAEAPVTAEDDRDRARKLLE